MAKERVREEKVKAEKETSQARAQVQLLPETEVAAVLQSISARTLQPPLPAPCLPHPPELPVPRQARVRVQLLLETEVAVVLRSVSAHLRTHPPTYLSQVRHLPTRVPRISIRQAILKTHQQGHRQSLRHQTAQAARASAATAPTVNRPVLLLR